MVFFNVRILSGIKQYDSYRKTSSRGVYGHDPFLITSFESNQIV